MRTAGGLSPKLLHRVGQDVHTLHQNAYSVKHKLCCITDEQLHQTALTSKNIDQEGRKPRNVRKTGITIGPKIITD
eukprot:3080659-Amphidinium_carterae.1